MTKQTLTAFIQSLDPSMNSAQMSAAARLAGYKPGKSTINTLRSTLGLIEKGRSTPSNAKSAAPTDASLAFRKLVARIGTDRARKLVDEAEKAALL